MKMKGLSWFSILYFSLCGVLSIAANPVFAKALPSAPPAETENSPEKPLPPKEIQENDQDEATKDPHHGYMTIPGYGAPFGGNAFGDSPFSNDFTSDWGEGEAFKPEPTETPEPQEVPTVEKAYPVQEDTNE